MKRRHFLKASMITGTLGSLLPGISLAAGKEEQKKQAQEFYELREYTFTNKEQQKIVEDYYRQAAIPAYNRLGIKNVGVFVEQPDAQQDDQKIPGLFVLIPHQTLDSLNKTAEKLAKDASYQQAAAAYLKAPAKAPAYDRIESTLMKAFTHLPQMALPAKKAGLYELRRYESPSEWALKNKVEMFNEGGELEIFKRVGLNPLFFGETLIGPMQPNLTYMIHFQDMADHDRSWKKFGDDPEWIRIKDLPQYVDTVSRIRRTFLTPTAYSQV